MKTRGHKPYTKRAQAVHRFAACAALGLSLAACDTAAPERSAPPLTLRNPTVTISSSTRFEAARFAGTWRVRSAAQAGTALGFTRFDVRADGAERITLTTSAETWRGAVVGPGRLALSRAVDGASETLWVLWVDDDFRTAALGNPEGTFAYIVDRVQTGSASRIAAARQVLAFNGYDLRRIVDVGP